jgi:hypothetical protein
MTDQDVVELFHRIEYGPEPPVRMRPETWLPAGRRAARQRRTLVAGAYTAAAAGVTAVAVGVTALLGSASSGTPGTAAAARPSTSSAPSSAPAPTSDAFDPMVMRFTADVPAGMKYQSWMFDAGSQSVTATDAVDTGSGQPHGRSITAVLHSRAHPPAGIAEHRTPAPSVQGHRAWWWCPPMTLNIFCGQLVWQWAPGAWASAIYTDGDTVDQARTRALAASVRLRTRPVTFAFSTQRPGNLPIGYTMVRSSPSGWTSTIEFGTPSYGQVQVIRPGEHRNPGPPEVTISVTRQRSQQQPNTTIGGFPARVTSGDGTYSIASDRAGYTIYLDTREYLAQLGGDGGARRFFQGIQAVPDPDDQAGWTATPVL